MTLREVLELEPLAVAHPVVHAGADQLDVAVSWVHISEMKRLGHLFQGGELLLTQGFGIGQMRDDQIRWVDSLADAQIAGVAVEVGVRWPAIPDAVVERARSRDLPLIAIQNPAYFMDITRAVHSDIVNSEYGELLHAEQLGKRLTRLVMSGASLQTTLDEMASAMSYPVVLTDRAHLVEAYSPRTEQTLSLMKNWRLHTKTGHDYRAGANGPMLATDTDPCLYQPIIYQGDMWGCLHVLLERDSSDGVAVKAMESATTSIGLAYAVADAPRTHRSDMRSKLVQDLLGSSSVDMADAEKRAHVLGADLAGGLRAFVLQPHYSVSQGPPPGDDDQRHRTLVSALLTSARRVLGKHVLVGYFGTGIGGIVAADASLDELGEITCDEGVSVVVGVSAATTAGSLVRAARDARQALRFATESGGRPGLYFADRLVLERILLKLDEDSMLVELIDSELGPLLDHDAAARSPLLETLEAYLSHGTESKADVARALCIERRTLYHRLERLQELLGTDLDDPDKQLTLRIALRGLTYRQKRAFDGH